MAVAGMHEALRQDLEADAAAADQHVAGHLDAVEEGLDDGPPGAGERDRLLDGPGQVLAPPHPLHPALALGVGRLHDAGEDVPACGVARGGEEAEGNDPERALVEEGAQRRLVVEEVDEGACRRNAAGPGAPRARWRSGSRCRRRSSRRHRLRGAALPLRGRRDRRCRSLRSGRRAPLPPHRRSGRRRRRASRGP